MPYLPHMAGHALCQWEEEDGKGQLGMVGRRVSKRAEMGGGDRWVMMLCVMTSLLSEGNSGPN